MKLPKILHNHEEELNQPPIERAFTIPSMVKAHRLHFFSRIYSQKMNVYALETNDTYGTKN